MTWPAKELGKVRSVYFGREDHGMLSFMIDIDFGGTGQGFGGYSLDTWSESKKRRVGTAAGLDLVLQLLDLFGVDSLDKIKGRPVYALRVGERIEGLETPSFDGGKRFSINEWIAEWKLS